MSVISLVDDEGKPITDVDGRINVRVSKGTDDQSIDDRFTDNVGHTAWPGGWVGGEIWTDCYLYANTRNVNPKYRSAALPHVDLTKDATVTLQKSDLVQDCPENTHDIVQVDTWFHKVASDCGARLNTDPDMQKMIPGLARCGVKWQNQDRGDLRERIYFPPLDANGASENYYNTGDHGQPFHLSK